MVCFTKRKTKEKKKGISIEYLRYGRDETFSGFCALGESKGSLFCGSWEGDICFSLGR